MHEFLMLRYFLRSSCENDRNRTKNANEMKRTESNKKKKGFLRPKAIKFKLKINLLKDNVKY